MNRATRKGASRRVMAEGAAEERPRFMRFLAYPPAAQEAPKGVADGSRAVAQQRPQRGSPALLIRYREVAGQSLFEQSLTAKDGVPASVVRLLAFDLGLDQTLFAAQLGISRSTLTRKLADNSRLGTSESELVLGVAKLVGEVERMVEESGDPDGFSAAEWVGAWLMDPAPALGRRRPLDMLDTVSGQEVLLQLLTQMQSGAYA